MYIYIIYTHTYIYVPIHEVIKIYTFNLMSRQRAELDCFSSMTYRKKLLHLYVIYMPQHHAALGFFHRIQKNVTFFVYLGKMYVSPYSTPHKKSFLNASF